MKSRVLVEREGIVGDKLLIHRNSNGGSGKAPWKRQEDTQLGDRLPSSSDLRVLPLKSLQAAQHNAGCQ
jgi:hypothetical protein